MEQCIAAKCVLVGDQILNSSAAQPQFRWSRVNEINPYTTRVRLEYAGESEVEAIQLVTSGWYTVKLPCEAVHVRRLITPVTTSEGC